MTGKASAKDVTFTSVSAGKNDGFRYVFLCEIPNGLRIEPFDSYPSGIVVRDGETVDLEFDAVSGSLYIPGS